MANKKRSPQRRRITEEQIREMMRLRRQGESIKSIAQVIGCHRQTVRLHLEERRGDMLRDEARKQILVEAIRNHFKELVAFAGERVKRKIEQSYPEGTSELRKKYFGGLFGLPGIGSSSYMVDEWERMHGFSSRDWHLKEALKEHVPSSPLWPNWDRRETKVGNYKDISTDFRHELDKRTDPSFEWAKDMHLWKTPDGEVHFKPPKKAKSEIFLTIEPKQADMLRKWLFGNALRRAVGEQYEELEIVKKENYEELVCGGVVIGQVEDATSLKKFLFSILEKAQDLPEWKELQKRTKELEALQPELRDLVQEMNSALDALSMMQGFPGRCHLCPI